MNEPDNVVALSVKPAPVPAVPQVDPDVLVNLMNFCTRVEEGLQHMTAALVAMESRVHRLELAQRKAERAKAGVLLNAQGGKIER